MPNINSLRFYASVILSGTAQLDCFLLGHDNNFEKASRETTDDFGVDYDYGSVMHYSSFAFSKNGEPTIMPKVSSRFQFSNTSLLFFYESKDISQNSIRLSQVHIFTFVFFGMTVY